MECNHHGLAVTNKMGKDDHPPKPTPELQLKPPESWSNPQTQLEDNLL